MKHGRLLILAAVLTLWGAWAHAADSTNAVRYKDNGDGTVTDCKSGLVWLKNATCLESCGGAKPDSYGRLSWPDAAKWLAALRSGRCGLKDGSKAGDWRLPTRAEFEAMVADARSQGYDNPPLTNAAGTAQWTKNGDAFDDVSQVLYWTSTSAPDDADSVAVLVTSGNFTYCDKGGSYNVWPVRRAR
jgi:hypothetical protein